MYNNALEIQKLHPEHNLNLVYFKLDAYNVFMDLMINSRLNIIQLILPIILIIPAIFDLHYLLKSGVFKDLMIRSSYKKVMVKEIIKCYLPCIIIPVFLIFTFFISYLFSGSFDIQHTYNDILGKSMNFPWEYKDFSLGFILLFIFNLGVIGFFFINVSLLFINKSKNLLLTVLFSFLTIMAYQIVSEVFVGNLLYDITGNTLFKNLFSLYNLWIYDGTNLLFATLYVLVLAVVSTILVYFNFRNREKVVILNEK
jgi:membrane protein